MARIDFKANIQRHIACPAKQHLHTFLTAYNFAKRLKTLKGLTPYEYICKIWTTQPKRFTINPLQHNVGLNIYRQSIRCASHDLARTPACASERVNDFETAGV
jgi:hypothetical protein